MPCVRQRGIAFNNSQDLKIVYINYLWKIPRLERVTVAICPTVTMRNKTNELNVQN